MISNGQIADANEVKPTLYGQFRDLIEKDRNYRLQRSMYRNNFIADGFSSPNWVASSTSWTNIGAFSNRPVLYWTTTNAAEIIGKTVTFPSTIGFATGYVDYQICETIDECDAGSGGIDTGIWDVILDTEESTQTYESGGVLRLYAREDGGSGSLAECQVRTDNAVLDSTHRYLALDMRFLGINNAGGSGGTLTNTGSVVISLHDGTDSVVLFSVSTTMGSFGSSNATIDNTDWANSGRAQYLSGGSAVVGGSFTIGGQGMILEAFYNADASLVEVYMNGLFYKSVSVSAVSPMKLDIYLSARHESISGSPTSNVRLDVGWLRREKSSPASSLAFNMSANNGSNYTSIGHETETAIANTGTQVKPKLTATISGGEYIHVRGYAAMLR